MSGELFGRTRSACRTQILMILQEEAETIRVTFFKTRNLPVGLELPVELLTNDVEHPVDIVADAREFAFDAF